MSKFFWIIAYLVLSCGSSALAYGVRAHWINSSEILLKLPSGFYASANTQFFLDDTSSLLSEDAPIQLPLIKIESGKAFLSTRHLTLSDLDVLIRRPLQVVISNNSRNIVDRTAMHFSGLLDELYFYDGNDLGGRCLSASCTIKLWAPTAQNVRLYIFRRSEDNLNAAMVLPLNRGTQGTWGTTLPATMEGSYYLYEITLHSPHTGKIETTFVTDPYSFSLSLNGTKSQLVNLNSKNSTPHQWSSLRKPRLNSLKETVVYELHLRDFSATDTSVPPAKRGTYLAFSETNSAGTQHLQRLSEAGLTHVHLLPLNDFGSVNETKKEWETFLGPSTNLQEPQSIISGLRAKDPYNWGYDPVHYFVPEGSYAVDGEGESRIREVREMVQSINKMGLRVVQDVVLNHTYQAGLESLSIFDKIVPLYYYRLDDNGAAHTSSCCWDTASENRMMEKLMIDNVTHWAKTYKFDGFRFDLMSFHSRPTMEKIFKAVRSLDLNKDGVDGSKILLYGEGWSFGSLFAKSPQDAMTIKNSYGSQYGFFNDRLRDAVRGGTTSSVEKSDQGFATGLFFDFNHEPANRGTPSDLNIQRERLLHYGDVIKVGLAGNLRDFYFREHLGNTIRAGDLRFRGTPVAFASQAIETVNYVSAHDGYGLWDAIQAKAPFYSYGRSPSLASVEERLRMHQLALSIPLLGQGIPFIESGTELLRSKNGDQDSYDSGDFFNRIDWTGKTNYWGEGLPPAWKNINDWSFWEPRLKDQALKITPAQISRMDKYFRALLRLRQSSDLFKMNTLSEISQHLHFIDNDLKAEPGLIAMHLQNANEEILVLFNASREARYFQHDLLHQPWRLHPYFDSSIDPVLAQVVLMPEQNSVQIPGRTTLVLQFNSSQRIR